MRQRQPFLVALGGGKSATPAAPVTRPARVPSIEFLGIFSTPPSDTFHARLRALRWIEGQYIRIHHWWIEGTLDRYPTLATELIDHGAELIVTAGSRSGIRASYVRTR